MSIAPGQKATFQLISRHLGAASNQVCPRIIGINGVDTSGKTCFALSLAEHLSMQGFDVSVIHLDDFHNASAVRCQGPNPVDAYLANAFNLELLEAELLTPLRQAKRVNTTLHLLDLEADTNTIIRHFRIEPHYIVLIEGVLLFRPPIDRYFDLRVFLDISFEEVLRRAELRDVPRFGAGFLERYRAKYIPIQQHYLQAFAPRERADILIDNTDFANPAILYSRIPPDSHEQAGNPGA